MNAALQLEVPEALKGLKITGPSVTPYGGQYKALGVKQGVVRVERHTHKYAMGETILDLGKIVISPEEVAEPKVHVWAIYEIPSGLNMLQGEHMPEDSFSRVRYYLGDRMAKWAFQELSEHNGTIQTLSPNFSGRDLMEMKGWLIKNYVHK